MRHDVVGGACPETAVGGNPSSPHACSTWQPHPFAARSVPVCTRQRYACHLFARFQGRLIWSINSRGWYAEPSRPNCSPCGTRTPIGRKLITGPVALALTRLWGAGDTRTASASADNVPGPRSPGARRLRARVRGEKPSAQPLPGNGAVAVLEGAGRPVCGQGGQVDDHVCAFCDRLRAAVVVEIGAGVAGVGRVDEDSV